MIKAILRPRLLARNLLLFLCGMIGMAMCSSLARAEYKIGPGDVLSLNILGNPDLGAARAVVNADGFVVLPLAGGVAVSGLSLADATAKIGGILANKEFSRRLDDGRNIPVIISPSQIGLSIVEYRPIYVNGDVAKPGELTYRPGLTVRQAVALAGGFDQMRFKMDNPLLEISDLTGEYNGLWIEYAKSKAVVARLKAELDNKDNIDAKLNADVPVSAGLTTDIIKNEQNQLTVRNADFVKERDYLRAASQKEQQRAQILSEQQAKEIEGVQADTADLQRYEDLFKKGALALPGLSEARRTVLLSSTRALQTTAFLASVQREQGDLDRRLDRLSDTRRIEVLHELEEATASLASTETKLQTVSNKLRFVNKSKPQLVRGFEDQVKINLTRLVDGKWSQTTVGPDEALEPGDVADIIIQSSEPMAAMP